MQRTVLIILTLLHHRKSHLSVKLSGFGDFCWKNFYFSFGKVWWFWSFLFLFTMVRRCWFSEISTFENFRKNFFFLPLMEEKNILIILVHLQWGRKRVFFEIWAFEGSKWKNFLSSHWAKKLVLMILVSLHHGQKRWFFEISAIECGLRKIYNPFGCHFHSAGRGKCW